MAGGRVSAKACTLQEREALAVSLRKQGLSIRKVAERVQQELGLENYPISLCHGDIDRAIKQARIELNHDAEDLRELELQRYDTLLENLSPAIDKGDAQAIKTAVQVSARRCTLLGLDAPIQIQVESKVQEELIGFLDSLQSVLPSDVYDQVLEACETIRSRSAAKSDKSRGG